jgi:hypothetical protein
LAYFKLSSDTLRLKSVQYVCEKVLFTLDKLDMIDKNELPRVNMISISIFISSFFSFSNVKT